MTNPFEDPEGRYLVVVNHEGQHALWPAHLDVPAGWGVVCSETDRESAIRYVEEHWTDMRPNSLITALKGEDVAR